MRVQRSKRAFFLAGWQRKEKETLPTKTALEYKVKRQATGKFRLKSTQLVCVALNFLKAGLWTVKKAISEIIYSAWRKAFINIDKIYLSRKLINRLLQP